MRCYKCPLFAGWNNENGSDENCGMFGDAWDSRFQYEDKEGTVIGCYIEKAYIDKAEKEIEECHEAYVDAYLREEGKS